MRLYYTTTNAADWIVLVDSGLRDDVVLSAWAVTPENLRNFLDCAEVPEDWANNCLEEDLDSYGEVLAERVGFVLDSSDPERFTDRCRFHLRSGALSNIAGTKKLVTQIEAELTRLGMIETSDRPTGAFVSLESDEQPLPLGWVRVADDYSQSIGPAEKILESLQGCISDANGEICWDYMRIFSGPPTTVAEWPADLVTVEQIEEGTPNDNPLTVVEILTNAGPRWCAGPHGVDFDCLDEAVRHSAFFDSRESAIAATITAE